VTASLADPRWRRETDDPNQTAKPKSQSVKICEICGLPVKD
jgi:hypothetical protein